MTDQPPTPARPVQQIHNPVKAPIWKPASITLRHDVSDALDSFCEKNGYQKREVLDVALRDYLKLPEPVE